jgi:hypothetical protein
MKLDRNSERVLRIWALLMNYKQFEQNLILWEPFIVMSRRTFAELSHLDSVNS